LFDKDGDGQITVDEVAQTMTSLGIDVRLPDVQTMVKQVDTDGQPLASTSQHVFNDFSRLLIRLLSEQFYVPVFSLLFS